MWNDLAAKFKRLKSTNVFLDKWVCVCVCVNVWCVCVFTFKWYNCCSVLWRLGRHSLVIFVIFFCFIIFVLPPKLYYCITG